MSVRKGVFGLCANEDGPPQQPSGRLLRSWIVGLSAGLMGLAGAQQVVPLEASAHTASIQAESRLVAVFEQLENNKLNAAVNELENLLVEIPNFRSAQLVYSDLLRLRSGLPLNQASELERTQLQGLHDELRLRLSAVAAPPDQGAVPTQFLSIDPSVRHAIAVDAEKSRLYLFANGAQGLSLIGDFYISVGKLGVDKREEGDQRTPLGMYFSTHMIPGAKLPDLYGVGALPVNYPNDWDRLHGRTGSGIWLHGSPSDQFARLPLASDGCVVLANPDMQLLLQTVDRRTPVLFAPRIDWVKPQSESQQQTRALFEKTMHEWAAARQTANGMGGLDAYYSPEFLQSPGRRNQLERQAKHYAAKDFRVAEVSLYQWSDAMGEVRIVNVRSTSQQNPGGLSLRQYWRNTGGQWTIFSEDVLAEISS